MAMQSKQSAQLRKWSYHELSESRSCNLQCARIVVGLLLKEIFLCALRDLIISVENVAGKVSLPKKDSDSPMWGENLTR